MPCTDGMSISNKPVFLSRLFQHTAEKAAERFEAQTIELSNKVYAYSQLKSLILYSLLPIVILYVKGKIFYRMYFASYIDIFVGNRVLLLYIHSESSFSFFRQFYSYSLMKKEYSHYKSYPSMPWLSVRHKETQNALRKKDRRIKEVQQLVDEEHKNFVMAQDTADRLTEKLNIQKRQLAEVSFVDFNTIENKLANISQQFFWVEYLEIGKHF
uniref:Uncharacterized protein n=1 Tax=Heterorhabditis bacteriophora TaxID=37862 RepID=A0A1I7WYF5_HETBA